MNYSIEELEERVFFSQIKEQEYKNDILLLELKIKLLTKKKEGFYIVEDFREMEKIEEIIETFKEDIIYNEIKIYKLNEYILSDKEKLNELYFN